MFSKTQRIIYIIFLVIVYFSYRSNFRIFSGQTPLGRPPTSFPTTQKNAPLLRLTKGTVECWVGKKLKENDIKKVRNMCSMASEVILL
jgi:hypothetical protein